MFNLIKSNRMENLMQAMLQVLSTPLADPMAPEWISVQSRGMKQWVSAQMADAFGVCANVAFKSPREIINWALEGGTSGTELTPGILTWGLVDALSLDWLPSVDVSAFEAVSHYLESDPGGQKQVMLARKLARVMDNYQIFRPQMLLNWEAGDPLVHGGDTVEMWQARLWRQMSLKLPQNRLHRRMQTFLEGAEQGRFPAAPDRICLFGISTLPPAFIEVLSGLAGNTEIYQFLLTPSDQFFSYIRSPQESARISRHTPDLEEDYFETGNPLLASLGRSLREFQDGLEEAAYAEPFGELFDNPLDHGAPSLLKVIQSDILSLTHRRPGGEEGPVGVSPEDRSLGLHVCHTPMREAQVLKDLLLDAFDRDPELSPHEVIVMMPDIEAYTPFIEAVFASEFPLPYAVSDRRKKLESQTLEAFVKILDLAGSRLELTPVLDLLLCPAIAHTFDITHGEMDVLESAARRAGILWGRNGDHRKALTQAGFEENTWDFGFKRLFTGLAVAEGREDLMAGVLPCGVFEGIEAELLGRFAHFSHTLFHHLEALSAPRSPDAWAQVLRRLIRGLMGGEEAPEPDMVFLLQTVGEMADEAALAGFDREISFGAMKQILEEKLNQRIAQGAFLSGGITFCNLMPMRSIPFKVVCLMGMDQASFPRQSIESGFDLMSRHPQKGDKKGRDEERYLFLESLISAREQMIITYTGRSIKDNGEIPCSGVVDELVDAVSQGFEFEEDHDWITVHGLHPFLPRYFEVESPMPSFSRRHHALVENRLVADPAPPGEGTAMGGAPRPISLDPPVALGGEKGAGGGEAAEDPTPVTLKDFVQFFRMPGRTFLKERLKIRLPDLEAPPLDREPFALDGLERYALGQNLLDRELGEGSRRAWSELSGATYPLARAAGQLPFGEQGRACLERIVQGVTPVRDMALDQVAEGLEPVVLPIDLRVGNSRISGQAKGLFRLSGTDLYQSFYTGISQLGGARFLSVWIHHLIFSRALEGKGKLTSFIIGRDPDAKKEPGTYVFSGTDPSSETDPSTDALAVLVHLYEQGQDQFLPFFPRSCYALARELAKKEFQVTEQSLAPAMAKASREWYDAHNHRGEALDRYLELYFSSAREQINPFGSLSILEQWQIPGISLAVFKPLLECLEPLS